MFLAPILLAAAAPASLSPICAQDPAPAYQPKIQAASKQATESIARQQVPEGFEISLWAAEPDLANPVAFCFDWLGRVYVAETFRQEVDGVPDNRSHRYWLEDDLRLQTVEERGEMYLKHHPEYAEDWTDQHDRIRRLVDTDGDGTADQATVYADGFNDLLDGTGAGLLARGKDVWYTCIPKLWKLTDEDMDGVADGRDALHHGYGVRVAFRGHDMHGLIIGPDGKLYFSIGDRGYNVMTAEGTRLVEPGRGAVFRCELDGTDLEVFAIGLRNPQELAFDDFGNLFTGDNNCDAGDRARLVYVMEGGDCGWSMNFQYLPDRGPWMSESWWKPRFDGQPAFLNPPLLNMTAGPSGFTHYPGVGLPAEYDDSFFLVDFRGGANGSGIVRFNLKDDGAGFAVNEEESFWWKILATDVDFGPDCKLYALDWVEGWVGPGKGRIYQLNHEASESAAAKKTAELLAEGMTQRSTSELIELFQQPDYRVRLEAQLELMARGQSSLAALAKLAQSNAGSKARVHAVWALTHLGDGQTLLALLSDSDDQVRAQAAKGLGEAKLAGAAQLIERLQDSNSQVRFFAAQSLGKLAKTGKVDAARATQALLQVLRDNQDQDRFLRHAVTLALGRIGSAGALLELQSDNSASARLGAVLALRHMKDARIATFLNDADPYIATEAAIAIYDLPIKEALPQIASWLHSTGGRIAGGEPAPSPLVRRALHAANRSGTTQDLSAVIKFVQDRDADQKLRIEAADLLADWLQPKEFDVMRNQSRTFAPRDSASVKKQLASEIAKLMSLPDEKIRLSVIRAATTNQLISADEILLTHLTDSTASAKVRSACLSALQQLNSSRLGEALALAGSSQSEKLRAQAVRMLAKWQPEQALPILADVLPHAAPPEQAAAFIALADLADEDADELLAIWVDRMASGDVDPSIQLELFESATSRSSNSEAVAASLKSWRTGQDKTAPHSWLEIGLQGGDSAAGKKVFFDNPTASCQRCHYIDGHSSAEMPPEVGPNLSGVGLNLSRRELLESIVDPAAKIASGFEFYDGHGELLPVSAMTPGMSEALTPRELRDLVAFLESLKKPTKCMIFVYSAGYEHAVARADESGMSFVEKSWQQWANTDPRFEVIISRDPNWFTAENLTTVDTVFFYTTGELPLTEGGRQALQEFVDQGGGFVGAHCATDTYYDWGWYGNMIGGYFDGHPWTANTTVTVKVDDPHHCSTRHFGDSFVITDEIYQMKEPYSRLRQHVLLSLDVTKSPMDKNGIHRTDQDFGISWTRKQGKGRVFYSSLGHRKDVWAHPGYRRHLVQGMLWAAGK